MRTGIGGGSESDWVPDPSPSSDPGGIVLANSSSKSSSSMGGIVSLALRFAGGRVEDGAVLAVVVVGVVALPLALEGRVAVIEVGVLMPEARF